MVGNIWTAALQFQTMDSALSSRGDGTRERTRGIGRIGVVFQRLQFQISISVPLRRLMPVTFDFDKLLAIHPLEERAPDGIRIRCVRYALSALVRDLDSVD